MTKDNKRQSFLITILIICALATFMYLARGRYVYEGDRALYMDDLSTWETFNPNNSLSLWEKTTSTGANKIRLVNNFALALVWKFIGVNYERIDLVLMVNNIILVSVLFLVLRSILCAVMKDSDLKQSEKDAIASIAAVGGALIFASSRFAYYSYEELFGIMEALGSIFTFVFIMLLFLDAFRFKTHYWVSYVFWTLAVYSHERYISLAGVLVCYMVLGWIYNGEKLFSLKQLVRFLAPFGFFALFVIHRLVLFGKRSFDGTSGTSMADTLSIESFLNMLLKQVGYLLGINAIGDAYLNGISLNDVNLWVYALTLIVYIIVGGIFVFYLKSIRNKRKEICKLFLFLITIACLAVASSGTIRVEMRWMYTSWGLEIITIMYMLITAIVNEPVKNERINSLVSSENRFRSVSFIVAILALLGVIIESYYVSYWFNIYNWGVRQEACSLSDCMDNYNSINTLYVINGEKGYFSDWDIRQLGLAEGFEILDIVFVKSSNELGTVNTGQDVVLVWDHSNYTDITDAFNGIEYEEGKYDDGWCENYVRISCDSGKQANLYLSIYIPDYEFLTDGSSIEIYINSELKGVLNVTPNFLGDIEVEGINEGHNIIELKSDFWIIDDSGRSENNKLAYVLSKIQVIER